MERLTVEYVPYKELKEYKHNAKEHPQEQVDQIAESIAAFGMNDPIAIDEDNTIIEGHGRLLAIKQLAKAGEYDEETVPVIRLTHMTDQQKKAYILAHNKLTMNTGFDIDILSKELDSILDIDMTDFGFVLDDEDGGSWFDRKERDGDNTDGESDEYADFVDKFKDKKTTDDCYTPDNIYDVVADWVTKEYGVRRSDFVRPFYPGGDYQREKYAKGCVVVDNPPFSIMSEIVDFYIAKGVRFFLFAPGLATFNYIGRAGVCAITLQADVTYENGANVTTSFLTNLDDKEIAARSVPDLYQSIKEANEDNLKAIHKQFPRYEFPDEVMTAAKLGYLSKYGQAFEITRKQSCSIAQLDAMKEIGKGIYGHGLLLSHQMAAEKVAAEKKAAEKKAAEKKDTYIWTLSEREKEIVRKLSENDKAGGD